MLNMQADRVKEARIALGAVAPVPLRAKAAEDFLKGRKPDKKSAEMAGNLALKEALPLARNKYKLQVARALVSRAVLEEK